MAIALVLLFAFFIAAVVVALILNASGFGIFSLSEHKKVPTRFSDQIPWALMVDPQVVFNKNGALMLCFKYRGPDLFSATKHELISVTSRFNNALKRLPAGWALYADDRRIPAGAMDEAVWPEPVSAVLDAERQEFFKSSEHFENEYFLTLVYLPPKDSAAKVTAMFYEGGAPASKGFTQHLVYFKQECQRLHGLLREVIPEIAPLAGADLLSYLHSCISPKRHSVRMPETPMYLDAFLTDTPLIGGLAPRLANHHLQMITVRLFPGESAPGLLDGMNRLPFQYRWVTRFVFEDRGRANSIMKSYQQKWLSGRKSFMTLEPISKSWKRADS